MVPLTAQYGHSACPSVATFHAFHTPKPVSTASPFPRLILESDGHDDAMNYYVISDHDTAISCDMTSSEADVITARLAFSCRSCVMRVLVWIERRSDEDE